MRHNPSLESFRDLIADALASYKSYKLPKVCVELGIQAQAGVDDESEAFSSKRSYVKRRIGEWDQNQLIALAQVVLKRCESEKLEDIVSELTTPTEHRVSELVRRDVLKQLNFLEPLFGELPLIDTLVSILGEAPFTSEFADWLDRSLKDRIQRHVINNSDWSNEQLLIECNVLHCTQARFFALLEKLMHPLTRRDAEQTEVVNRLSAALRRDGYTVKPIGTESGYAIYGIVRAQGGVDGAMKNLIFASIGEKPELLFKDALNNDVEIVKHADKVLIFNRPLPPSGLLLWRDLRDWWAEKHGMDASAAKEHLYKRLLDAVIRTKSPGEYAVFKGYYESYGKQLGDHLPALIPQVYLHFDPFTRRQRGDEQFLARQRMDFLLMLDHGVRVVIEIDGQEHYGTREKADARRYIARPRRYAEMVHEDRRLKLRGYEVFRFGGYEFMDVDVDRRIIGAKAKQSVAGFFAALLARYEVI